jgi:hypothetical protein
MLHVVVSTDSRDRAVELVRRMEKSNHFRQAQVVAESVTTPGASDQGTGPANIQFDIAAIYVPAGPDTDIAPASDKPAPQQSASAPKPASSPGGTGTATRNMNSPTSNMNSPASASPAQAQNVPPRSMRERSH